MFDLSRVARLLTLSLAACAVTWAFAGGALARPAEGTGTLPGTAAPVYRPPVGDHSTPNPAQVRTVLHDLAHARAAHAAAGSSNGGDDGNTVALILSIAAIVTALGAVTLTVTRTHGSAARA